MRLLSDMQSCGRKAAASDESAESGVKLHRGRIGVEEFAIDSGSGSGRFCDLGPHVYRHPAPSTFAWLGT